MRHFAITRQQRKALFRIFQRDFPGWITPTQRYADARPCPHCGHGGGPPVKVPSKQWRTFRKTVHPGFDKSGCVMVKWQGMWLGIEVDGYCHS
jgi:hypothetical protein